MKKINKLIKVAVAPTALVALICSGMAGQSYASTQSNVTITLLSSDTPTFPELQQAVAQFHQKYPNITMNLSLVPQTGTPLQDVESLYASGNAPTIYMGDPVDVLTLKNKIVNLTHQPWVKDVYPSYLSAARSKGQIYGFPMAVVGYGIIYNKKVVDKAVGGDFNPYSINTQSGLKNLMNKIQKSGVAADYFAPMNWSLGSHFLGLLYDDISSNSAKDIAFVKNLSNGRVNLSKNPVFNGLMNTFNLLEQYNIQKASPLAGSLSQGEVDIATGKVGLFFQGDWIAPDLKAMKLNPNLGFLPVPISNNPKQYGNSQIPVFAAKFFVINKVDNTPQQISAAEKFLDWLALTPQGQKQLAVNMTDIPAFKNNPYVPNDSLDHSIKRYMKAGKALPSAGVISIIPSSQWLVNGNSMQKYMVGAESRAALATVITKYWESHKLK